MTRLLHLTGSAVSDELAELSVLYAAGCLEAAGAAYDHVVAHVSPDGSWRFPDDLSAAALAAAEPRTTAEVVARLVGAGIDVALPQMFCLPGMTTYRSLLRLLGIPHVGNTPETMAIGADKAWARALVADAGVAVPRAELLRRGDRPTLAPPVVVKPVDADNSAGVALVRDPTEYAGALEGAWGHGERVLVEEYVELGREVRCGVVERDGELVALPLEEYAVDPEHKPIRLADDKLARGVDGDDRLTLVAKTSDYAWIVPTPDPPDPTTRAVHDAARTAHRALGCRDHSLFDFRIDPSGRPWFLEAGLYCSFAPASVVVAMAEAAGTSLADLLAAQVRQAARRGC